MEALTELPLVLLFLAVPRGQQEASSKHQNSERGKKKKALKTRSKYGDSNNGPTLDFKTFSLPKFYQFLGSGHYAKVNGYT